MSQLSGRIAIITGASMGMGEAHARLFVERGAKVVLADIVVDLGEALADELGENALFVRLDVVNEQDWAHALDAANRRFGVPNVLVGNAAWPGPTRVPPTSRPRSTSGPSTSTCAGSSSV